jgi:hypothetical protein
MPHSHAYSVESNQVLHRIQLTLLYIYMVSKPKTDDVVLIQWQQHPSPSQTSPSSTTSATTPLLNLTLLITSISNYLLWKAQIVQFPYFQG